MKTFWNVVGSTCKRALWWVGFDSLLFVVGYAVLRIALFVVNFFAAI